MPPFDRGAVRIATAQELVEIAVLGLLPRPTSVADHQHACHNECRYEQYPGNRCHVRSTSFLVHIPNTVLYVKVRSRSAQDELWLINFASILVQWITASKILQKL